MLDMFQNSVRENAVAGSLILVDCTARLLHEAQNPPVIVFEDGVSLAYRLRVRCDGHTAEGKQVALPEALYHGPMIRIEQDLIGKQQHEIGRAQKRRRRFDGMDQSSLFSLDRVANTV